MQSGRKFVVLNRPASGESSHSVFGLDIRVLRMLYTLAVCYLLFRLRGVLLLPVLSIAAAYIRLPAVEIASGFLTHKRHKGGALARVFLIVLTILFSVGGVVAYYAFQQPSTLAQQVPTGLLLSVPVLATLRLLYRHAVTVNSGQRPNFWEPGPAIPY
jgi:predicted PurR-regulated permease PerM